MGVETQVVYPTLFIGFLTDDVALDVALCRAYNRFMADAWARGGGRLRWVVVPPLQSLAKTMEEMQFGKDHGAVGVMFRGIEKDRTLGDPYFHPVYEEAGRLGLPICVHTGPGCPALTEVCDSQYSSVFPQVRMLPVMAFFEIVFNKIPERFPETRFGFIEANSSWVPYVCYFLSRRFKKPIENYGPDLFRNNRLFVACEAGEDLPYILRYVGEDNLISGSDYGHQDPSSEPELVQLMRARQDVPTAVMDKILCDNPKRFYGI